MGAPEAGLKRGTAIMLRVAAVSVATWACAACANEGAIPPMGLGFHGQLQQTAAKPVVSPPASVKTSRNMPTEALAQSHEMKQTIGGKVLSAIALERVTGRKPDPRRFKELR